MRCELSVRGCILWYHRVVHSLEIINGSEISLVLNTSESPEELTCFILFAGTVQEDTWKKMWGPCPDKHGIKITDLSPLLKESSPKNHLQQNLNESIERRCASDKEKREKENASCENGASQEIFEEEMAISPAENLVPTFKDTLDGMTGINGKSIDTLIQKLSEKETHNTSLRRKIAEREEHIKELSSTIQLKKVKVLKEDYLSGSVNTVEAHLHHQIQRKEVENNELKLKTQTLEKKIAEWKLQVGECKRQMLALRETSEQKKADLRRAIRSQKRETECFEEAVENLTSRIKEREVKLSEILSASNVWKKQHDRMVEEKKMLAMQTEDLKKQITSLSEDLKRKEEYRKKSNEEILGKLNSVNSENEKIYLENEKLKASLAALEISTVSVENDLLRLQEKIKLQENFVEHYYKNQVQELQAEVLKSRHKVVFSENKRTRESKCLEVYEEEDGVNSVGNYSLEEENSNIQKKYEHLKRMLEKMEFQNEELAYLIKKEDESLQCSKLQLEEKIAEYNSLTKQLESALEEGRKMVVEEFEKMSYLEQALQKKMFILENELRERQEEKKQLLCEFHHNEKHHAVCLKELENSLQRSEYKNQSIQNYVQFLQTSYITMFG
ncbi:outer dense fiber protein 2-like isoform X4 [Numida meleagris]|uniref:outer dense fiber protein 2-like isoform X4 n=1 Tax=Numida meleagris TaxID=8996 RepID=UPI000B3D8AB3|nr:outer dense fiber protein 2-like isoform X4 [Numida meleagris]